MNPEEKIETEETEEELLENEETIPSDLSERKGSDLSDEDKEKILKDLERFSGSDFWKSYQEELLEQADNFELEIDKIAKAYLNLPVNDKEKHREGICSQFDRDVSTYGYIINTIEAIRSSLDSVDQGKLGAKIFCKSLEYSAKDMKRKYTERIEPGYDIAVFTVVDMKKHQRSLRTSPKVWLAQTTNNYRKPQETEAAKSAY